MQRILVVDDDVSILKQLHAQLGTYYEMVLAKSGELALHFCMGEMPDLILLDIAMPGMDGFEVAARLRMQHRFSGIPIIFLTADRDPETEVRCLAANAVDFIAKSADIEILRYRIGLHLRLSAYQAELEKSVVDLSDCMAISFVGLIEYRDENTGGHVMRTARYVEKLGRESIRAGHFAEELSKEELAIMVRAAPLHDIGKIAISDSILRKPGRLNDMEFTAMKKHASFGAEILNNMYKRTPSQRYLQCAAVIADSHHERFDGTGYPHRLAGSRIPLAGRIMAVADVYDSLVHTRVYRKAMSHEEAARIILDGRGSQFDPFLVDVFEACQSDFEAMSLQERARYDQNIKAPQ